MRLCTAPVPSKMEVYGESVKENLVEELERLKQGQGETKLFQHQIEAVLALDRHFQENGTDDPGLIVAPTGSGKTGMISLIPYVRKSARTLIVTPSPVVSDQLNAAISLPVKSSTFFEIVKFFPEDFYEMNKNEFLPFVTMIERTGNIGYMATDIVIMNAQKLGGNSNFSLRKFNQLDGDKQKRIKEFFKSFDLLIMDEAHHFPAPLWKDIVDIFKRERRDGSAVFLTATPFRNLNGNRVRILSESCEAYNVERKELEESVIRKFDFGDLLDPSCEPNYYSPCWMDKVVKDVFHALAMQDRHEPRFKHKAMVLVRGAKEATLMAKACNSNYPKSATAITGGHAVSKSEIEKFKNDDIVRVAIVCKMLTEGFDNPKVSLCVIYRELNSQVMFEQFVGRCLRKFRFPGENMKCSDTTKAIVLSYKRFNQEKHFNNLKSPVVAEVFARDD